MTDGEEDMTAATLGLRLATVEVEQYASQAGWDQPSRLFALVPTVELAAAEPELAAELGISDGFGDPYTPVEQELEDQGRSLEELLDQITWPPAVAGALAVVERLVLPPEAEDQLPDELDQVTSFAAQHDKREDVRIVVGVLRSGEAHCVLRMRSHDSDDALISGSDVVPALVEALRETLDADADLAAQAAVDEDVR